jgi:very-short-patch-repair endonuclease
MTTPSFDDSNSNVTPATPVPATPALSLVHDSALNYAFQQNAIPVVKELCFRNDALTRKNLVIRISTEPAFAAPEELRIQSIEPNGEFRIAPLDLKLSPDYLAGLNEKVAGLLKVEVLAGDVVLCSRTESVSLLARNEWCGLVALPEILAAFILPNDPALMPILGRASDLLRETTGRGALNGYQDKNRKRAWDQVAAIYRAVAELGIRYINPPASFESTGQKVSFPAQIVAERFGTCLDLALLFAACCERAGLHPLVLMHEGHAYTGCWLEERTFPEPAAEGADALQQVRKHETESLLTVFETTLVAGETPGVLADAERAAHAHLQTEKPFRLALDVRRARIARIVPLPIPGQRAAETTNGPVTVDVVEGIGSRDFSDPLVPVTPSTARPTTRIDQWKSRLLDLSLRNRLLNFRETKSTIRLLSAAPEHVEDELAAENELALRPRPKLMSEDDPRHGATMSKQQRADALAAHLADELQSRRLHTHLDEDEHARRLTELYRAARNALDENGTNTLFAAVGILEWRETEHSDRVFRAPLLLVPVELKRKSVLEGFSLCRLDEETRLNVTLMEMLRQHFQKDIAGLDPLPEDETGVNVARVFQLFRDAVRDLAGWEVKDDIWLGQFSFTKFLLWKDLADRLDDLTRNRIVNHLVNAAGTPYDNPPDDITPALLDDRFHPRDVFCPRSADSSQLAAVMAAAAGHDFVLEGPPGTGKSQTITNIIAHCLAHGKRVLFVAEKRAALDVVHRRLREEGLEPFCLELHSNKIGKADVLAQFDRSLKFMTEATAEGWEHRTAELERLRTSLNDYTRALHRRTPCGLSAHACFDYLLPRQNEATVRLDDWPRLLETTVVELDNARLLARQLQERSRAGMPLHDHPLAPLACEEWLPTWAERTPELIRALVAQASVTAEATHELRTWLRCPGESVSRRQLQDLRALTDSLSSPEPVGPAFATTPWHQLAADLDHWRALAAERDELRVRLRPVHAPQAACSIAVVCEGWTTQEADSNLARVRELTAIAQAATEAASDLRSWLYAPRSTSTRDELSQLSALSSSLIGAFPVAELFATVPWTSWVSRFDRWIAWVDERAELRAKLADYDESKLLALDLDTLKQKWDSGQTAWFIMRWLRIGYVRRHLRSARSDQAKPEVATLENVLVAAQRLRAVNGELGAVRGEAESLLGCAIWAAGEPDPAQLKAVHTWGAALHQQLAVLTGENGDWLAVLRQLLGSLFKAGPASFAPETTIGRRLSRFRENIARFTALYEMIVPMVALNREVFDTAVDHLPTITQALDTISRSAPRLRIINAELGAAAPVALACLGAVWAKGEPEPEAMAQARAWGEALHGRMLACAGDDLVWLGQLRQLLAAFFAEGPSAFAAGTAIGLRLSRFREALVAFEATLERFAAEVKLRREVVNEAPDHLAAVRTLAERVSGAWRQIREWCSWQKARRAAVETGLAPVIAALESPEGATLDVPALFERSFRRALLFALIEREPALREFFGREHNERIERFRELDEKIATLSRELIRARLAAGIPRDQGIAEVPKAEIGLLRKELGKRMRHIPVRKLLAGIPKLLPRLKPCVLMSPLSVAQYLEATHETFDLVIFDEASQIPVWDAIGAIARGKQLIMVGDPKQLPPTNFFGSGNDDEDDLTPETHKDLESVLDELMSHQVRHKRLQWHYRSRHEGLITFSNRQYYENDLLTFPSPESGLGGVRLKHLPDARYDKGKSRTNLGEAQALVADLVTRLRSTGGPRRSYGIVTFSLAQQQLVENLLDEERRKYPEIENHFGDEPPVEGEPVFVKNLENVQGDERDVILFSICYGPDEAGKVAMNFGPLNRDGGERRLNVAITRAKHEVLVFSGLRADQIDLTRTRARGVRDLKLFLDYAERGPRALAAATTTSGSAEADSEFEKLVADRLRAAGYTVHHQVGCSGYRIDLAVVDPSAPGRYLLGIECDGATYHRAATARDRDKLRQLILEGLGWKLHRIWSTDWWHDADKEMEKLLQHLRELRPSAGADAN